MEDACIFCDEKFDFLASHERGRHLVDTHRFGQCDHHNDWYAASNLGLFKRHLVDFHGCDGDRDSWGQLLSHFRRRIKDPDRSQILWRRGGPELSPPTDAALPREESPQTRLVLQSRLDQVFRRAGVPRDTAFAEFDGMGVIAQALRCLDQHSLSPPPPDPGEKNNSLPCFEAACIEEEMVVSGFDNLVFYRRPPDHDSLIAYLSKTSPSGDSSGTNPGAGLFSIAWVCRLPNNIYFPASSDASKLYSCISCAVNTLYNTRDKALKHLRDCHMTEDSGEDAEGSISRWVEEIPLNLEPSWITSRSSCRNFRETIHWWFRAFMIESHTLRTLLRTSRLSGCTLRTPIEAGVVDILESWDVGNAEEARLDLEEVLGSDGAVDSRDNLKSLQESLVRAAASGKQDPAAVSGSTRSLWRKRLLEIGDSGASKRIRVDPTSLV